jgi:hypothetical protein
MSIFFREGEVISIDGDTVDIQLSHSGFCSGQHKCAFRALTNSIPVVRKRIRAKNSIGARAGEKVVVEILSPGFYRSLFFEFIPPVIALLGGCVFGIQCAKWMNLSHKSDLFAGLGVIVCFSVYLFVSRFINQHVHPRYLIQSEVDESLNCDNCSLAVKG